jgi:hypothetical protein
MHILPAQDSDREVYIFRAITKVKQRGVLQAIAGNQTSLQREKAAYKVACNNCSMCIK